MARQQGYIVRLAVFIPVDYTNMDDVVAKANMVKGLQDGSAFKGVVPERFAVTKTSREDAMDAIGDPDQTDIEEAIDERDGEEDDRAPVAPQEADDKDGDEAVPAFLKGKQGRQKASV